MPDRFISLDEVLDLIGFSKTHLYRLINAGDFPRPVPLGVHKIGFLQSEVEEWMANRIRARDQQEGSSDRQSRARSAVAGRWGTKPKGAGRVGRG